MRHPWLPLAFAAALLSPSSPASADGLKLVSVEKIWDAGAHNAFTDLVRWDGRWWCTFRESEAHVGGDGKIRVIESTDGKTWKSAALISEEGIDLRDPKFSVTPDNRLMIVAGGSVYGGTKVLKGRRPRVLFSKDGHEWTKPVQVLSEGEWLWRVTWHGGKAYGISYNPPKTSTPEEKAKAEWSLKLFSSEDGIKYSLVTVLDVPGHPNESTIRFRPDGEAIAMVRRESGDQLGWIGTSKAPYTEWKWSPKRDRLGGPNFIELPDGHFVAASRLHTKGSKAAKTAVGMMTRTGYTPELTLPSAGDTSYPGLVYHDGLVWMSYYSTHEGKKTSIYLAKIKVPLEPMKVGTRLEPFFEPGLIDHLGGSAALAVQRPEPREMVFRAEKPWEGNTSAYFTVFRDGDRFRMYYRGSHFNEHTKKATHREVTCYAESTDGIRWTRPDLGLFEFDGSKANNIVWDGPGSHNFTPFLDDNPACPSDAKYKALAGDRGGLIAYKSADGIRWSRMADKPVITEGAFDSQNLAFYDANAGFYRAYHRMFRPVRDIMTERSTDFLHWTKPVYLEYPGMMLQHLYTNAVRPYFRAPHVLIGFPTRFLPEGEHVEPAFMASRDGLRFTRYGEAVVPRTAPQDRDGNRSNYMVNGLLPLPGSEKELSVYATEAYYTGPASRVRRFVYRLDGFVALHAGADGGEAVTLPMTVGGASLFLNARATGGEVRAELQDVDGTPLPGFALADCTPFAGDDVAAKVSWKGGTVPTGALRLKLQVKDADVFAFEFR